MRVGCTGSVEAHPVKGRNASGGGRTARWTLCAPTRLTCAISRCFHERPYQAGAIDREQDGQCPGLKPDGNKTERFERLRSLKRVSTTSRMSGPHATSGF